MKVSYKPRKGYLTRNFSEKELSCPCGDCDSKVDYDFLLLLQSLRTNCGHALTINSAFRCPAHNKKVGGTKSSQHLKGTAVDISTKGWTAEKKHKLMKLAFAMGFKGVAQGKSFIHLDMRSGKTSTWVY